MCGRFVQAQDPATYARYFLAEPLSVAETSVPSYNVAPTDRVFAVAEHEDRRQLGMFRWGLIPWWAKEMGIGSRHINARAETVDSKPAFRESFAHKRCLIPADGFFEWERSGKGKLPHYIHDSGDAPLALAGLWATWRDPESGEKVATCTIVTTDPNDLVAKLHNRMPVVLPPEHWDRWLDREFDDVAVLRNLLVPAAEGTLTEFPVSTLVNSVRNNMPECISPLEGLPDGD